MNRPRKRKKNYPAVATPEGAELSDGRALSPLQLDIAISTALALITLIPYAQTFSFDFVNFDDPGYVYENVLLRDGLTLASVFDATFGFHQANWHPLVWLSYMLEIELFGMSPGPMHITNVVLHILSSLVLYLWLRSATGCIVRSLLAALIFAIHPEHVESVAWITERKDVLSTLFFYITLASYTRYCQTAEKFWYIGSLIAFAIGLTAKGMLVTVPVVLLLIDVWPLNRLQLDCSFLTLIKALRRLVAEKIPFILLSAALCLITIAAQKSGGAMTDLQVLTIGERLANSAVACVRYCLMTVWPLGLSVYYPMPDGGWHIGVVVLAFLFLVTVTTVSVLFRKNRPVILVGWMWFLFTLVPVIGLVQVGIQSMADRYMYIPGVGLSLLLVWSIPDRFFRFDVLPISVMALLTAILLSVTYFQVSYWRDSISLFRHSIDVVPKRNVVAFHNLPLAYLRARDYEKAIDILQPALNAYDTDPVLWIHLGNAMRGLNRSDDAIECFRKAVKFDPTSSEALNNLGLLLCRTNNAEGMHYIQRAIEAEPGNAHAHNSLGNALVRAGDLSSAEKSYLTAIRLGNLPEAKQNLDYILSLPEVDSAIKE